MNRLIAIVGVILLAANLASAKDLKTYRATYEKEMDTIVLAHGMKMMHLSQYYTKSLDILLAKVKKAGDLDKTMAVLAEKKRFEKGKAMPEKPSALLDIQNLQSSFTKQASTHEAKKAKQVISLASKYDQALERLQRNLVSSSKLDDAVKVQVERKRTAQSDEVVTAQASATLPEASKANRSTSMEKVPARAFSLSRSSLKKGMLLHYTFNNVKRGRVTNHGTMKSYGTVQGEPKRVKGIEGMGFEFDGVKDYVIAKQSRLLSRIVDGDYSLCAWVRPEALAKGGHGGEQSAILSMPGYHVGLEYRGKGTMAMAQWFYENPKDRKGKKRALCSNADSCPPGEWYHVVGAVSAKDKEIRLYVNGELRDTRRHEYEWSPMEYSQSWHVAISAPWGGKYKCALNATIDEVRIYDRTVSTEEVKAIYDLHAPKD